MDEFEDFRRWVEECRENLASQTAGFDEVSGSYHEGQLSAFESVLDELDSRRRLRALDT